MASRKYSLERKKSDLRFGILSPRQTPVLQTSVSQVMTPTRLTSIYTRSNSSYAGALKVPLEQLSVTKHDIDSINVQGQLTKIKPTKQDTVLETEHTEIKPEVQGMTDGRIHRENEGLKENHVKVTSLPTLDSELFIQHIENQIIPDYGLDKAMFSDTADDTDFYDLFPIIASEEQKTEVEYSHNISSEQGGDINSRNMGNISGDIFIPQQGLRSHTSSIGSNSLGSEYGSLSTRCSICDGCNSALLSNHPLSSNSYMFNYRSGSRHENGINKKDCSDPRDYSVREKGLSGTGMYCNSTDSMDRRTLSESGYNTEDRTELPSEPRPHRIDQVNPTQTNNILSNFIVLATWIQFSRYKDLQIETLKQKKVLSDYERRLESMIVMVLLLSKQMKKSVSKLDTMQLHLTQQQDRQVYYEKRLMRIYLGFVCLLLLYIVQVTSFKKQLYSVVRFLGIFEVFEKINRTRKVVAKNWRNIPSLLTDFWRIFIFRSRSRLQERFS